MSPEKLVVWKSGQIKEKFNEYKSDVFSLGLTFLYLALRDKVDGIN